MKIKTFVAAIVVLVISIGPTYAEIVYTFQEGDDNQYDGTIDTFISELSPVPEYPDQIMVDGLGKDEHGLLKFDNIFGVDVDKIPIGSTILSATLILHQTNTGIVEVNLHKMLSTWDETSTWNGFVDGIQPDGSEAASTPDDTVPGGYIAGPTLLDVTDSIQAWASGETNYGWALLPGENSPAGRFFGASEWSELALRPELQVTIPEPATLSLLAVGACLPLLRRRRP